MEKGRASWVAPYPSRAVDQQTRNRKWVIHRLLPRIFGILSERGRSDLGYIGLAAHINGDVTIVAYEIDSRRTVLSVYWPLRGQIVKVFSGHIMRNGSISEVV